MSDIYGNGILGKGLMAGELAPGYFDIAGLPNWAPKSSIGDTYNTSSNLGERVFVTSGASFERPQLPGVIIQEEVKNVIPDLVDLLEK